MNEQQKTDLGFTHALLLVIGAGIAAQWLTAEYLDDAINWHFIGYCLLGLITFRLVWGFVGSRYAFLHIHFIQ